MNRKQILFLGTHGQHNVGDELLLETFLTQLGRDNLYFVNSYDPAVTADQLKPGFEVDVFHTTGEPLRFLRYLLRADLVFFGGGSIIKELYASVGRSPYSTLIMVLLTVSFAHWIARVPVVMSNIGVGPIRTARGRRLAAWILKQVDLLSVRDARSYETCLALGLDPERVLLVSDAVFVHDVETLLESAHTDAADNSSDAPAQPIRVALNLNYDIENPANWETFLQNLEDGLCALNRRHRIEIHALPMQSNFKAQNDWRVLAEFSRRIPEIATHLHRPETFGEVASIIARCDLLISARLHSIVIAAILGKPCLALTYDVKVRELVSTLGIQEYAIEINQPFDPAILDQLAGQLVQSPDAVSHHLLNRTAALRSEMEAYISSLHERLESFTCH